MLKAGQIAPSFRLSSDIGRESSLEAELAKGPVLLAFFKVTCPTCQFSFPYLGRMAQAGVPVIGVSQDDAHATRQFKSTFGVTFPTLLDPKPAYSVSNAYGITYVPSLFLIEPDGRISLADSGFRRATLEEIGSRFGAPPLRDGERVPDFKPG